MTDRSMKPKFTTEFVNQMEKIIEEDDQLMKTHCTEAIRCAKAALLISSLRNACTNSTSFTSPLQDDEEVEKLKIKLVKETQKLRKSRLWIAIGVQIFVLFPLLFLLPVNSAK